MRFMVVFLIAIALLGTALFVYPPWLEDTDGECRALEQRVAALGSHDGEGRLAVSPLYGSSSSSPSGVGFARDHYPLLPPTVGCAFAYWLTVFGAKLPAAAAAEPETRPRPRTPAGLGSAAAAEPGGTPPSPTGPVSTIARDMTLNGDPISPGPLFTLPMSTVAIRVEYPGALPTASRFQLMQGRAVLDSCVGRKAPPHIMWCRFAIGLRKGNYAIAFVADNALVGRFPFTVLGN